MRPFEDEVNEIMVHYHDVARAHGMDRALREAVESNVFVRRECAGLRRRVEELEAERDALKEQVKELEAAIHAECTRCAAIKARAERPEDCNWDTCPLWPHRPGAQKEGQNGQSGVAANARQGG